MRISDWSADVCSSDLLDVISGELLARAGGGLGLTAIATPLAGMLAFVDVGDAKAAACGPVLTGARAAAQRTDKGKPRDDVGQGTTAKSESGKASKPEKKEQIGRASGRERVWQYVEHSGVAGS